MIDSKTKVCLKNVSDDSKTVWLSLPFDEDDLNKALLSIDVDPDDEEDAFDRVLSGKDPSPGYVVCGHESPYLSDENFDDIFAASDLCERIEDLDDENILEALLADGDSLEDAIEECEDGDIDFYPNTNLTDLAEQFGEEGMFSDEYLREHVDWESVGRDLELGDGYREVAGGVLRRN